MITDRTITAYTIGMLVALAAVVLATVLLAAADDPQPQPPPTTYDIGTPLHVEAPPATINAASEISDHTLPPRPARGIPRTTLVAKPEHPQVTTTAAPPAPRGTPRAPVTFAPKSLAEKSHPDLVALRWCENRRQCQQGDCYRSDPGDRHRGAYQFKPSTWASVGGTGDPAAAPPAEQDARALELLRRAGAGQWPTCGRLL